MKVISLEIITKKMLAKSSKVVIKEGNTYTSRIHAPVRPYFCKIIGFITTRFHYAHCKVLKGVSKLR
jgi:hypothetical protein